MEIAPDAPRTPEEEKAAALERCCAALGVSPEYFDGKRVVDLGCGVNAWFARALKERGTVADIFAVEWRWLLPEEDHRDDPFDAEAVARELGDRAIAADFVLDEVPLGGEVDSIVSVGSLTLSLQGAEGEWLPEVQASARGLLAKLALGGELRVGPLVRQTDEPGGGAGYVQARAILSSLDGDGFEVSFESAGEKPERGLSYERAIVRRTS